MVKKLQVGRVRSFFQLSLNVSCWESQMIWFKQKTEQNRIFEKNVIYAFPKTIYSYEEVVMLEKHFCSLRDKNFAGFRLSIFSFFLKQRKLKTENFVSNKWFPPNIMNLQCTLSLYSRSCKYFYLVMTILVY
jgi:hypothetical protein